MVDAFIEIVNFCLDLVKLCLNGANLSQEMVKVRLAGGKFTILMEKD